MRTLTRWIVATSAAVVLAHAVAANPVNGTEVVVTDAAGHQLVGYGVVSDGLLVLRMGGTPDSFVLLLIAPDGVIERFDGVRGAGGALLVDLPDGSRETLNAYLSQNNVSVRLVKSKPGVTQAAGSSSGGDGSSDSSGSASGGSDSSGSDGSSSDTSVGVGTDTGISVDTGDTPSSDSGSVTDGN